MLPHVGPSGAKSARSAHSVAVARWTALPRLDRVMRKLRTRKLNAGSEKKHTRAHRRWTVGRSAGNFDDAVKMVHGATELAIHEVVSVVPPLSCDWHSGRADGAGVSALMGEAVAFRHPPLRHLTSLPEHGHVCRGGAHGAAPKFSLSICVVLRI